MKEWMRCLGSFMLMFVAWWLLRYCLRGTLEPVGDNLLLATIAGLSGCGVWCGDRIRRRRSAEQEKQKKKH